jgi:hypothetical protein
MRSRKDVIARFHNEITSLIEMTCKLAVFELNPTEQKAAHVERQADHRKYPSRVLY